MKSALTMALLLLASTATTAADQRQVVLDVSKMDCAACPITVRKALEKVPGVGQVKVDFKTRQAIVSCDPDRTTPQALTNATGEAGYPSTVHGAR